MLVLFFLLFSVCLACGMEKWRNRWRWREWTRVTVSRRRNNQTLTHFHSAHRQALSSCLGAMPGSSGRVTLQGSRIPLFAFDVRPPSTMHVCMCLLTWLCEGTYLYVRFCRAEKWNQRSLRAGTSLPPPSFNQNVKFTDRESSVSRTATSQACSVCWWAPIILQQQLRSCTSNSGSYDCTEIKFMDYVLTVTWRYFIWRT